MHLSALSAPSRPRFCSCAQPQHSVLVFLGLFTCVGSPCTSGSPRTPQAYTLPRCQYELSSTSCHSTSPKCFPALETLEDFILVLENIHPRETSAVVNESEEVLSPTQGTRVHFSAHITVDEIQWLCGSTTSTGRKSRHPVLASNACLTEVEILGVIEVETRHHSIMGKLL